MSEVEVIRGADEHWWETRWNCAVEYKGEKYVICVEETPKWGNRSLHHYDSGQRFNIGDEVVCNEIYENIIDMIDNSVGLSQSELYKGACFGEDDDLEFASPPFIPEFSKKSE